MQLHTVKEASEILELSADTIRRWDKKGLIKSSRSEHNHRLFSLEEIRRIMNQGKTIDKKFVVLASDKITNFSVVELFAGAGGTSLGMHNAGLQHKLLVEFNKDAGNTLKSNMPEWNVVIDDVKNIDFTKYESDIVQGGFPCQAFSHAGKKRGFEDTRGTLFFEFARAVKEIKPKIAVAENVKGLLNHDNGRTLETMVTVLVDLGYKVHYKIMRSQYLDVPQKRERLIILAIRNDLDIPFIFPKENDYVVGLRSALKDVPESSGQKYPEKKYNIMKQIPEGGYWRDLPLELQKSYMGKSYFHTGGKTGVARRLSWDEPSLTLTTSPAQMQTERCHPSETRPLTVREYARIQSFPDSWKFEGSVAAQYKQIGNAVPVNLGYHIGKAVIAMLEGDFDRDKFEVITLSLKSEALL
jgi:DNA (cytosine-5)-methyltransferase 1